MESPLSPLKCSSETSALEGGQTASLWLHIPFVLAPCMNPEDTGSQQDRVWEKQEDATG